MSIQSRIVGGKDRTEVLVTKFGQIITSPIDFSTFYLGSTAADDVPVNVVPPKSGFFFVVTSIILSGDRSIGANGAVTTVFTSDIGPVDTVQESVIITEEIAKQTRMTTVALNIRVPEAKWVNVVSDDVIVRCNISGYYVGAVVD
jgi:hypothetical protein